MRVTPKYTRGGLAPQEDLASHSQDPGGGDSGRQEHLNLWNMGLEEIQLPLALGEPGIVCPY